MALSAGAGANKSDASFTYCGSAQLQLYVLREHEKFPRTLGGVGYRLIGAVQTGLKNADAVVSEFRMSARNLILGHVTGDAVLRTARAGSRVMIGRSLRAFGRSVAMKTGPIVGGGVTHKRLVRVMASEAGDSSVTHPPAAAEFKTVRLKADGGNPFHAALHHVCPGAVTRAAEINGIDGVQLGRIQRAI
jgi:hypothetical protein